MTPELIGAIAILVGLLLWLAILLRKAWLYFHDENLWSGKVNVTFAPGKEGNQS